MQKTASERVQRRAVSILIGKTPRGWACAAATSLLLRDMGSQRACGLIWEPTGAKSSSVEEENTPGEGTGRCPDSEARKDLAWERKQEGF